MTQKKIGVILILLTSIAWAIDPVLTKLSYSNASFIQSVGIRGIFVAIVAGLYMVFKKQTFKISKTEFSAILFLAIVGSLIGDVMYFYVLTKISVVNAAIVGHLQPIFILLFGYFLLKNDKITKYDLIGMVLMIVAAFLVVSKNFQNIQNLQFGMREDYLYLISTVAWSGTTIVARKYLQKTDSGVVVFSRFFISSIVMAAFLISTKAFEISNIYQVANGLLVGVALIMYYESLSRLKAAQVTSLELTSPFFAAVLGILFLSEGVTIMQVAGMVVLVAGVYFLSRHEEKA